MTGSEVKQSLPVGTVWGEGGGRGEGGGERERERGG